MPPRSKWSANVQRRSKVFPSQTKTLPSMLAVASSSRPPGLGALNPTDSTESRCPVRQASSLPVSICRTLTVASSEPVTTMGASGCEQMEMTALPWTCRMCCCGAPARGFQTITPRSSEPVQITLPPKPQHPQVTLCAWPAKICISFPVGAHHIQAMASVEPARIAWPLGCHRIHSTSLEGPSRLWTRAPFAAAQTRTLPS
mmetsp:Transcript_100614/g.300190  ORF Transcript_100614/g.300190 Transcript_100614/m.300190 type:complete len:201 (-) Transcript_100614:548-1150(-)